MNAHSLYAFYGSLRRGMSNYHQFRHGLTFLYDHVLQGYRLYKLDYYPYAVRSADGQGDLMVEVFKIIDPTVEKAIHDLELGVGYYYDEVTIRGMATGIYLFDKAGNEPLVKGGDWVKFFRT